jgi:hypothetical protein
MKRHLCTVAALLVCGVLLAAPASVDRPVAAPAQAAKAPGVEAAQALSTLTGVAISPLLGVGAVGAWKYWRAPSVSRDQLPWFAQPWFWGPALLLVMLVFVKDLAGTSLPTTLKKPFDLIELFENKVSGLVMAGAFVPIIASIFHSVGEGSQIGTWGLGMIDLASLGNVLVVPLALAAFVVVFLAGHAVNVLILISPFTTLDAALKSARLFLVSTVAATSLANPYVGAAWALIIILVSYFIAGWTVRLTVFGTVFAWDLATLGHRRFRPDPRQNWAFTARKIEQTPVRTYGRLSRDEEGRLTLRYRPWLILPPRTLTLPPSQHCVGRGLLYPEIRRITGEASVADFTLPPRCRTHEEGLVGIYRLAAVEDIGLRRGFKAVWQWLKNLLGARQKSTSTPSLAVPAA